MTDHEFIKRLYQSNMSDEFHEWLSKCPCTYHKKYGEDIYEFIEEESPDEES